MKNQERFEVASPKSERFEMVLDDDELVDTKNQLSAETEKSKKFESQIKTL